REMAPRHCHWRHAAKVKCVTRRGEKRGSIRRAPLDGGERAPATCVAGPGAAGGSSPECSTSDSPFYRGGRRSLSPPLHSKCVRNLTTGRLLRRGGSRCAARPPSASTPGIRWLN